MDLKLPDRLYKYVRRDGVRLLDEKRLRVPSPIGFNDPFEVLPKVETLLPEDRVAALLAEWLDDAGLEEIYAATARGRGVTAEALRKELPPDELRRRISAAGIGGTMDEMAPHLSRVVHAAAGARVGMLCFTETPDSLLMWGHYADGHRGLVYGFDPQHAFFDQRIGSEDGVPSLQRVEYSRRRPRVTASDTDAPKDALAEFLANRFFFTKSNDWSYECEWRLVLPLDPAQSVDGEQYVPLPEGLLTTVILGSRVEAQDKDRILELVSGDEFFRGVEILEASISDDEFRIDLEPAKGR
ncbi:MAG TPA: DUF2971 domain-containing protein [Gemmatimonadota bacterium]|nr:DUF2971 domain-containing protein [Gemmatimonadota bacterium]